MKEIDVRRAIHKLDLKPNTKLTLLGILCFVKWDSFTGQVSAKDISKEMNINERSVKRALKELIELGLLSRSAQRRSETQHHRAMTKVNVERITGTVITRAPSVKKTPPSDNMTLPPSDIVTPPSDIVTLPPSDNMTLPPSDIVTPNTTKDNNKGYTTEVSTEESNEEQVRLERLLSYGVTPENAERAITEYMDDESSDRLTAVIALERMAKINYDAKKRNERMRRFR